MMGNRIKTGSKRPKTKDRMLASAQLPPLPKMYQMGIAKGVEQERERIVKLLEDSFYPLDYPRWQADELMEEIFRLIKGEE